MATIIVEEIANDNDCVLRRAEIKGISLYDALERAGFIQGELNRAWCIWCDDGFISTEEDADTLTCVDREADDNCYYHVYVK